MNHIHHFITRERLSQLFSVLNHILQCYVYILHINPQSTSLAHRSYNVTSNTSYLLHVHYPQQCHIALQSMPASYVLNLLSSFSELRSRISPFKDHHVIEVYLPLSVYFYEAEVFVLYGFEKTITTVKTLLSGGLIITHNTWNYYLITAWTF